MALYVPAAAASTPTPPTLAKVSTSVYIGPPMVTGTNTIAPFGDKLYVVPVCVGSSGTVTKIGCEVTTLAAGNARLGIYANDTTRNLPGTLVLDAGTVSTGTTGEKEITISQAVTAATWYWLAIVMSATPSLRGVQVASTLGIFSVSSWSSSMHVRRDFTYAALPADESAQTYTYVSGSAMPLLWLRG